METWGSEPNMTGKLLGRILGERLPLWRIVDVGACYEALQGCGEEMKVSILSVNSV